MSLTAVSRPVVDPMTFFAFTRGSRSLCPRVNCINSKQRITWYLSANTVDATIDRQKRYYAWVDSLSWINALKGCPIRIQNLQTRPHLKGFFDNTIKFLYCFFSSLPTLMMRLIKTINGTQIFSRCFIKLNIPPQHLRFACIQCETDI